MTGFKVGDRVRRVAEVDGRKLIPMEGTISQLGERYLVLREWGHTHDPAHFELVSPAPTEPTGQDIFEEFTKDHPAYARLQAEFEEFKAKTAEAIRNYVTDDRYLVAALEDLGLKLPPSRFRVSFEVEAEDKWEALGYFDNLGMQAVPLSASARVEKIEEE